jgi:high-affinity iron transporter
VLGAITVSASFAAVLTYSTNVLNSGAQEAVGGILSVLAVSLVTWMIFWMRRTARSLSGELTAQVNAAARVGIGALAITAFVAVGREGLETTLFIWTAVKASGETFAPLVGAGVGIALSIAVCWLLYHGAVRVNLGVFFSRTAILLIVIAAGILSYGLGDLQDAGLLSDQNWVAFDFSNTAAAGSWWMSLITGLTDLSARMTVLQTVAWIGYLAVVLPLFIRDGRSAPATASTNHAGEVAVVQERHVREPWYERWVHVAQQRVWIVFTSIIVLPAVVAVAVIVALPATASADTPVNVTATSCGAEWTSGHTGSQNFTVTNTSGKAGEVILHDAAGAIVGEIETLGPATTAMLTATLNTGTYAFTCNLSGQKSISAAPVQVTGMAVAAAPQAVVPPTVKELTAPNRLYQAYAATQLTALSITITAIQGDLAAGNRAAAQSDWLAAQQDWERVGASYNSFGDLGLAVDGLPLQYPQGVNDPHFTGLHRLEYGLWHGESFSTLQAVATRLVTDVESVREHLTSDDLAGDPTNLALRAHEILEDAMRDHLTGIDDQGAGAGYAMTYADTQITETIVGELTPLIDSRAPKLVPALIGQLTTLQAALHATRVGDQWQSPQLVSLAVRQKVNAAIGAVLETASSIPGLLEVQRTP